MILHRDANAAKAYNGFRVNYISSETTLRPEIGAVAYRLAEGESTPVFDTDSIYNCK